MDKVLIAAMVAIAMVACDRGASPDSANRVAPPSAQTASRLPDQSRDTQIAQLSFEAVDTNKDGVITPNEALAVPNLDFSSADTDKSRTLDRQEFAAAMATARPGG